MPEFIALRGDPDCNVELSNQANQSDVNKASEVRHK
jgi:hypothetical protein